MRKFGSIFSVVVFVVGMQLVPWEQLKGHDFNDLENYRETFLYKTSIFEEKKFDHVADYFSGEALWHYVMLKVVRGAGVDIDLVFTVITTICLATFGSFIVARHGPFSLILLCSPLFVNFAFEQVRMALAYSLMLIAYTSRYRWFSVILCLAGLFIHTAMIIVLGLYYAITFLQRHVRGKFNVFWMLFFLGVAVSIAIGPMREVILSQIGDRRAYVVDVSASVFYSSYWVFLLCLMFFQDENFYRSQVNCYAVVILSVVTANLVTGGYSLRFLSVGLPMIMSSVLSMEAVTKSIGVCLLLGYLTLQWMYWLRIYF